MPQSLTHKTICFHQNSKASKRRQPRLLDLKKLSGTIDAENKTFHMQKTKF